MSVFLDPTKDVVFKTLWLKGNNYVRKYLERMVEYAIGHKLSDYDLGPNETGIISYKNIANKVDILLVSCDNHHKINIEMNRLNKYPSYENINSANNKSMIYLGSYINSYYNDLPQNERYKGKIQVEQVNFNNFYCEENKLIHELHFELVDKNYDITKDGIKIHQIYLPRLIEVCYDKEEEIYRDFLLLTSKSYEAMEEIASGDKCRSEVVKFLKRLGADEEYMAVIDREEYNRIQEEITLEYEKDLSNKEGYALGIEQKAKEDAINFYQNGVSKELICKSLKITEEKLDEYLKESN